MNLEERLQDLKHHEIALGDFGWALQEILKIHNNHGDCTHPAPNEHIPCKAANTCDECQYAWPCRTVEAILNMEKLR